MNPGETDMNIWLEWGVPIITWLQGLGDVLLSPMEFFTFLGTEEFYLLIMPAILWCWDARLGFRIGLILLTSDGINGFFKISFGQPRPYWVSDEVNALSAETSFGLPSGHSQTAVAVWGRMAAWIRQKWAYVVLGLLIFLISISRLYLGVHFPTDVLLGWTVGGLLLWAFLRYEEPLRARLASTKVTTQIFIAFLASIVLILLGFVALAIGPTPPSEWIQAASTADEVANPRSIEGMISTAGALFGLGAGGAMLFAWDGFKASGAWWRRLLRYLVGVVGVAVIYFGLKAVFPDGVQVLRYLRYALVAFWMAYLAPRTFVALRLA
jgi:membrane-associated phospholipid phosphatase